MVKTSYIEFKWYVWKSHGKAQVDFVHKEGAEKAFTGFTINPFLD